MRVLRGAGNVQTNRSGCAAHPLMPMSARRPKKIECDTAAMGMRVSEDDLRLAQSWGAGPEVIFLSSPLADPVD